MIRSASILSILFLSAAVQLSAQGTEQPTSFAQRNISLSVSVSIIDNLVLATLREFNLNAVGEVDGFIEIVPVTSSYAGLMRIQSRPDKRLRITYMSEETLIDQSGSGGIIRAKYRISGFESDNQLASVLLDAGEATIRVGPDGYYYIWLGARLDVREALPGDYVSEFILELEDVE